MSFSGGGWVGGGGGAKSFSLQTQLFAVRLGFVYDDGDDIFEKVSDDVKDILETVPDDGDDKYENKLGLSCAKLRAQLS